METTPIRTHHTQFRWHGTWLNHLRPSGQSDEWGYQPRDQPGKGSRFYFTISAGAVSDALVEHRQQLNDALDGLSVLVVDDNLTNRRILGEQMRSWEMRPTVAVSAREALEIAQAHKNRGRQFDIVLTDLHMPEMDGFQLSEALVAMSAATSKIIMLTSGQNRNDTARFRELGIAACLTKPARRNQLRAAISLQPLHRWLIVTCGGKYQRLYCARNNRCSE